MYKKGCCLVILTLLNFFYLSSSYSFAGQWLNPKDVIGEPRIAQLLPGQPELSARQKEELKTYGYTAREIMAYLECNKEPGRDNDSINKMDHLDNLGNINSWTWLRRNKHYYRDYRALFSNDGIKPGDIRYKKHIIFFYPTEWERDGYLAHVFYTSEDFLTWERQWGWITKLRRIKLLRSDPKEDSWAGTLLNHNDRELWRSWEEDHQILGKDIINGKHCLVIESKNRYNANLPLSRRVSWVEINNFLDLHEERFDSQGKLCVIADINWEQIKPSNYWVMACRYFAHPSAPARSIYQTYGWIFDQGLKDTDFRLPLIQRERFWRKNQPAPIAIKNASDFPPPPKVRTEFWDKHPQPLGEQK